MIKDNLYIGKDAREKLVSGIRKVAHAVGGTMGTGGANSIIEAIENPGHLLTNDGITIAQSIKLADPIEDMGRKILLESISRANKASGDGSSTTCVLTSTIIEEGMKHLDEASPMDIKKSLEACLSVIEESINKQKREITVHEVGKVAAISAEDEQIGATIQEIYEQIGKDGIIHWDISKTTTDSYTIGNGITVEGAGFVSPYMADMDEKTGGFLNVARWKKAHVLITKQKITSAAEFNNLFETLFNKEIKEIVVFCDEYEPTIIPDLIKTRAMRGFKTLLVKMPILWKDWWYEDLAKASGATVIDPNAGITHKNMNLSHLGMFDNILVSKEDTFIDGVRDLTEHITSLEEEGSDDSKLRASRLNTKTARYFVGAQSDSALSYRRLKVEDAISAAWQALHGGIVAGGGIALVDCVRDLPDNVGGKILWYALKAPCAQIVRNAGFEPLTQGNAVMVGTDVLFLSKGIDTHTGKVVNMFDANIIDPANIVLNSVKNAISVAASVLTANTLVTLPREEPAYNPNVPVML